jgi:hypothetical protein
MSASDQEGMDGIIALIERAEAILRKALDEAETGEVSV